MKIEAIRYFLALCNEKNFTRAAARCGIAQSSMTVFILRLEKQLGGALFRRNRNSQSEPTELALAMKPHLQSALRSFEAAQRIAEQYAARQGASGSLVPAVRKRPRHRRA